MSAIVFSIEAAKQANLHLTEEGKGSQALHNTLVAYRAGRRSGTACTKSRAEVAGSGKKLWNQKGTGNARMGSRRSPIWRGGGVVWGPKPRDYSKKVNKKVRTLALRVALTQRLKDGDVLIVQMFEVSDGKTKSCLSALRVLTEATKVVVVGKFDAFTLRAAKNIPNLRLLRSEDLNAEDILNCQKLVFTAHAIETLARRTATEDLSHE
jgi:large subunit ribosomal protein L4